MRKFNVIISLRSGKRFDTHVGENDVNVTLSTSSTPYSKEYVSDDVSTSLFSSLLSRDVEEPKEGESLIISDSKPWPPLILSLWLLSTFPPFF